MAAARPSGHQRPPRLRAVRTTATTGSSLSAFCPLLKAFAGGDPSARNRPTEVALSGFASIARLPRGTTSAVAAARDEGAFVQPALTLYEFEACPFCRSVREALTELDLDAAVVPCAKGSRHRATVAELGGKEQFPYLVDETAGVALFESEAIIAHLWQTYGGGVAGPPPRRVPLSALATVFRMGRGMVRFEGADEAKADAARIELYNYEGNQFARLVRECLCELDLPFTLRNVPKGSPRRAALTAIDPDASVPYLVDGDQKVGDSKRIIEYLCKTYASSPSS